MLPGTYHPQWCHKHSTKESISRPKRLTWFDFSLWWITCNLSYGTKNSNRNKQSKVILYNTNGLTNDSSQIHQNLFNNLNCCDLAYQRRRLMGAPLPNTYSKHCFHLCMARELKFRSTNWTGCEQHFQQYFSFAALPFVSADSCLYWCLQLLVLY